MVEARVRKQPRRFAGSGRSHRCLLAIALAGAALVGCDRGQQGPPTLQAPEYPVDAKVVARYLRGSR